MTVILAVKKDNQVWIGSDTLETQDEMKHYGPKIVKLGKVYVGASGNGLLTQILDDLSKDFTFCHDFMPKTCREVIDFVKMVLKSLADEMETWPEKTRKEAAEESGDQFIIATPSQVFVSDVLYATYELQDVAGIGSGGSIGLGVLYSHYIQGKMHPREMLELALDTTCRYHIACDKPLQIVQVHEDEPKRKRASN